MIIDRLPSQAATATSRASLTGVDVSLVAPRKRGGSAFASLFRSYVATVGLEIGVAVLAVIVVWGGLLFAVLQQRDAAYHEAVRDNRTLALAFEENIVRTIGAIDQTLQFVQSIYQQNPGIVDVRQWIRPEQLKDRLIVQIRIIDKAGALVSTTPARQDDTRDFSNRDYFRIQRESRDDTLFIGKPTAGERSAKWSVHLSRRLTGADGAFAGVAVVSIDPYELSRFYASLKSDGDSMSLVGMDGIVRARAPLTATVIGESVKNGPLFSFVGKSDGGDYAGKSSVDQISRIYTYRTISKYQMIVVVGREIDQISMLVWASIYLYVVIGIVVTLITAVISYVIIRKKLQLLTSKQSMADLLNNISQGIIMVDEKGRIPVISRSVAQLLGLPKELLSGFRRFDDIVKWQVEHGEFGAGGLVQTKFRSFIETAGVAGLAVYERTRPNGTVIEIRTNLLPSGGAVRTYTDVTERKRSEARIVFLAQHDPLTSLANRTTFQKAVNEAIESGYADDRHFAVLLIDLDRFKLINDLQGHATGDLVLRHVADRLRQIVRGTDIVARLGGDEFAILQRNVNQPHAAMHLANRIVERLKDPFLIDGKMLSVGVSVGVAPHLTFGQTAARLMKDADVALYCAKEGGRSQACLFDPLMDVEHEEARALEADLRAAMAAGQFVVHYQPMMDVMHDRMSGFEALLRWTHPSRGTVPPTIFVPIAERIGLIAEIGAWVIRTACLDALRWPEHVGLNVNVSPVQFRIDGFPEQVFRIVKQAGLDPHRLTLEITESVLIEDGDRVSGMIDRLRGFGLRVALDDFGAGHSSLSYLRRFAFDSIKIDKSFVDGIERDHSTCAIVSNLLKLGHDLNIEVVAEGVESAGQLEILKNLDCRFIQGFLFGRPQPIAESVELIRPGRAAAG